jgi:hypothetical protein
MNHLIIFLILILIPSHSLPDNTWVEDPWLPDLNEIDYEDEFDEDNQQSNLSRDAYQDMLVESYLLSLEFQEAVSLEESQRLLDELSEGQE